MASGGLVVRYQLPKPDNPGYGHLQVLNGSHSRWVFRMVAFSRIERFAPRIAPAMARMASIERFASRRRPLLARMASIVRPSSAIWRSEPTILRIVGFRGAFAVQNVAFLPRPQRTVHNARSLPWPQRAAQNSAFLSRSWSRSYQ